MDTQVFFQLALILVITKSFGLISRKIHLPQVVGALIAGIILGPAFFGLVTQNEFITGLAQIGVVLLMFTAGLETDLKRLRESLKASLIIALFDVTIAFAGAFALSYLFGIDFVQSLFIGIVLTSTSISITVETLNEMGKLKTRSGTTILGVAIIDDIIGVIILSFVIGMGVGESDIRILDIGIMFAKIIGFFLFALVTGYAMHALIDRITKNHSKTRRLSIFSLGFCFFLAFAADWFGIAAITGAYMAGLSLSSCKAEEYVERRSSTLSYLFFSPIFFVSVGLNASLDWINPSSLLFAGLLLVVAVITKIAGNGAGALLCKLDKREALQIGSGMVARGEVSIIIATTGLAAGYLDGGYFSMVIAIVIITTLITPLLLKLFYAEKSGGSVSGSHAA